MMEASECLSIINVIDVGLVSGGGVRIWDIASSSSMFRGGRVEV
jgi:hypothetical protein